MPNPHPIIEAGVQPGFANRASLTLIGLDETGELAVFSEPESWHYRVYDRRTGTWLETADPAFPRFTLDEEDDGAVLTDLETGCTYRLSDAAAVA